MVAEKNHLIKKKEFYALQDELAEFTDRNRNISSAQFQNQKLRLEAQYSIVNAVYTELAKQKEQAAIQVSKDTPIFSVIDPVVVPKEKTSPKRGLLLVIYTFLGVVLSIGYVLVKEPFKTLKKEITAWHLPRPPGSFWFYLSLPLGFPMCLTDLSGHFI